MLSRLCCAKGFIVLIIVVLLAALLLFSWIFNDNAKVEMEEEMYDDTTEGEYTQLLSEKSELENKISDCQYKIDYGAVGPVVVLFSEPGKTIKDLEVETSIGLCPKAVLAVSEGHLPGDSDFLTADETKDCVREGWEIALTCTGGTDLKALNRKLENAGFSVAAVYYPDETATVDTDVIKELGIEHIIQYSNNIDGFFAYGIGEGDFSTNWETTEEKGDCTVIVIGKKEREKTEDITAKLLEIRDKINERHSSYENITGAAKAVSDNHKFIKENRKQLKNDLKEYKKELKEIEKKIDNYYVQ